MDAIVLFSHGSLLCGAGVALEAHAARLRAQGLAPIVEVGYLNYSAPFFLEAVARCVQAGASRILVTPYFLVPGKFVRTDLPKAVQSAQAEYPALTFVVAQPIGFDETLADALIASARAARPEPAWRDELRNASAHCRARPDCPLFGTPDCPRQPTPPTPLSDVAAGKEIEELRA